METAFLALGTNLGDRLANLEEAISLFEANPNISFIKRSSWLENPAVEGAGPDDFLNGVIQIETSLNPFELFDICQSIEKIIDPERDSRGRKLARKIDIDILFYGEQNINEPGLSIPHPRMFERDFVMKPLAEIAPELCKRHAPATTSH